MKDVSMFIILFLSESGCFQVNHHRINFHGELRAYHTPLKSEKTEKKLNATCNQLAFQGPGTTRLFQVHEFNKIMKNSENADKAYNFCARKIVYGHDPSTFSSWSRPYQLKYNKLSNS